MNNVKDFIGKTLVELAGQTSMFWKPVHVFALEDKNDTVGKRMMDAFTIQQVIDMQPSLAHATVVEATNYYGEVVLRVRIG